MGIIKSRDVLRPWLRRELMALLNDTDVDILVHLVESFYVCTSMQQSGRLDVACRPCLHGLVSIDTAAAAETLKPFLFEHTEHFLHELATFAQSTLNITTYDELMTYKKRVNER